MGRYTARDITVLEGLDPVRHNPGMFVGGTGPAGLHHLLWEIVDNAVDEAMNGYADRIEVTLHRDGGSVTVTDNGRGIPVDRHAKYRKPALELILTTLHAGGKFEAKNYYHSGGLHGVGASVVAALSERLVACVRRDGAEWEQSFARGKPLAKLGRRGPARGTGTSIFFRPDPKIFPRVAFDPGLIAARLEAKAYLHRGLKVRFRDETSGGDRTFCYEEGIRAYLGTLVREAEKQPVGDCLYLERQQEGLRLECALLWTDADDEAIHTYVNSIPTTSGGTHEAGLRAAVVRAVRNYLAVHEMVPRGLSVTAEDIRAGLVAVLSCYVPHPQFQGQTKERLNNPEIQGQVDALVRTSLENHLLENRTTAEAVAQRVILAARARSAARAAAQTVQRKGAVSHRLNLPGKLADCTSTDPSECEIFIVEGDSAGGSAKQARERRFQAILPLRGKVLNSEQASAQKVLSNKELSDIVSALGCGAGKHFDIDKLRYHKICLLMDADSDGNHICTLLLTFFYRHLRGLIDRGCVYIAQPPLYRVDVGSDVHWARDDAEKDALLARFDGQGGEVAPGPSETSRRRRAGARGRGRGRPAESGPGGPQASTGRRRRVQVTRFKGLGEMNPATLKETTLNPAGRTLVRVGIDDARATDAAIQTLMGREVQPRFAFIMERAPRVEEIDV